MIKYQVCVYYKAQYSNKYYMIQQIYHRDKKHYYIYCCKDMSSYVDIGVFCSRDLGYTRMIMDRFVNAGPEEELYYSSDGQLVDLNCMEVK